MGEKEVSKNDREGGRKKIRGGDLLTTHYHAKGKRGGKNHEFQKKEKGP